MLLELKANFELYLAKLLSLAVTSRPDDVLERARAAKLTITIPLWSVGNVEACQSALERAFVPRHGLGRMATAVQQLTGVDLGRALNAGANGRLERHQVWPQIRSAFQVRHALEHNNGRIDSVFLDKVKPGLWRNSSWGRRGEPLETGGKPDVCGPDVQDTQAAMLQAVPVLASVMSDW